MGQISSAGVSDFAYTTSGYAYGEVAANTGTSVGEDVSGAGVTTTYSGANASFLLLESGDFLLQEVGAFPNNRFLLE